MVGIAINIPGVVRLSEADKARALDQPGMVSKPKKMQSIDAKFCQRCRRQVDVLVTGPSDTKICLACDLELG